MDSTVTEVPLRKRSTPYEFEVILDSAGKALTLYKGVSPDAARTAYWQAVHMLRFLASSGHVRLGVTRTKKPYGSFATEVEAGAPKSLHIPSGECKSWMSGSWTGVHLREKILATIPGMPAPFRP